MTGENWLVLGDGLEPDICIGNADVGAESLSLVETNVLVRDNVKLGSNYVQGGASKYEQRTVLACLHE